MLRLLAFLLTGCWHKWKILRVVAVYETGRRDMPGAYDYELQCERCGTVRAKRT